MNRSIIVYYSALLALVNVFTIGCSDHDQKVPSPKNAIAEIEQLKQMAAKGDREAQWKLALIYEKGQGVSQDQEQAFKWYLKAAESGKVEAIVVAAERLSEGNGINANSDESKKWWRKAADAGNAKAQFEAASEYGWVLKGSNWVYGRDLIERQNNLTKWLDLLQKSSSHNYAEADYALGMIHMLGVRDGFLGEGAKLLLPPDQKTGLQHILKAAQKGEWKAQWALAVLYQAGFGDIKADKAVSEKHWNQLAAHSEPKIQRMIGLWYWQPDKKYYKDGKNKWQGKSLSFEETNRISAEWFEKAAKQGDVEATYQLAQLYKLGLGVFKDDNKYFDLLKRAAEKDYPEAMLDLGSAYYSGSGIAKDYSLALNSFTKAANQTRNNDVAMRGQNALGAMNEFGWGAEKNDVVAYAWYNLSAAKGMELAKQNLVRVEQRLDPNDIRLAQGLSRDWKPGNPIVIGNNNTGHESASNGQPGGGIKMYATGTGFIISSTGNILTNNHVTAGCKEVRVPAENKIAKLLVADEANDLAVVKMDGKAANVASLTESDEMIQGDEIVIFGYPLDGFLPSSGNITPGIISALAGPGNNSSLIQITAPVQPGNSGGPVLNKKGQVVGVVVGKADAIKIAKVTGDIPQNINFAIAGRTVKSFLDGNHIEYRKKSGFFTLSKDTAELASEVGKYSVKLECWR